MIHSHDFFFAVVIVAVSEYNAIQMKNCLKTNLFVFVEEAQKTECKQAVRLTTGKRKKVEMACACRQDVDFYLVLSLFDE